MLEKRLQYFTAHLEGFIKDPEAIAFARDYQVKCLHKTVDHMRSGETHGWLEAPAGGGKTEVMFAYLNAMMSGRHEGLDAAPRIYMIEPTRRLISQTKERLAKSFPHLNVGTYYSEVKDLDQPITLITQDSFYTLVEQGIIKPAETDLLLIDEAHRMLSDPRRHIVEQFKPHSLMIGLTASSEFDEAKAVYRILGKRIHKITDKELVESKPRWLCPRANIIAEVNVPAHSDKRVQALAQRKAYVDTALALYLGYQDKEAENEVILGQKGLIYGFDIDHADQIVKRFNSNPHVLSALRKITGDDAIVPATLVHGDMSEKELNRHFKDFADGKTHILVGDQLFIEGIDLPSAAWEVRRAGNSYVEAVQAGGRVSRMDSNNPAKTGRVFNVYMPSSSIKRPIFHTDILGTPRLGRITGEDREYRNYLPDGVELQPLPSNLTLHNSPHAVESFLKRLRPEKTAGVRYLAPQKMAEEMGAWPEEMARIYDVLKVNYPLTPASEKYVEAGGSYVPRSMIRDIEGNILLTTDAKAVLADIVTPLVTEGESFITLQDALERCGTNKGNQAAVSKLYQNASSTYSQRYLQQRFPSPGTPKSLASEIVVDAADGLSIPMNALAMVQTDQDITLGIHEDVLSKFWHRTVPEKTSADVPLNDYALLVGAGVRNPQFRGLWEEIRHRYDSHPSSVPEIDGEKIICGYKQSHNQTAFYVDTKHVPWFQSRIGRDLGNKTEDWMSYEQFFKALGQDKENSAMAVALWRESRALFDESPSKPVNIDGHTVQCGYTQVGDDSVFCLHKDEAEWVKFKAHEAVEQYNALRGKGYHTIQETIDKLSVGYKFVYGRAVKVNPGQDYSAAGLPSVAGEQTLKGRDLVWKKPRVDSRDRKSILLAPGLVEGWQKALQEQASLLAAGYKTIDETSKLLGFDRSAIETRLIKYKPNSYYTPDGLNVSGDAPERIKGDKLIWHDPYRQNNNGGFLLHPRLVAGWKKTFDQEKHLKELGYQTYSEASEISQIDRSTLQARRQGIDADKAYVFEGENGNKLHLTGSELVYVNPYNNGVLLHPALVRSWAGAAAKEAELITRGYKTVAEANALSGVDKPTIIQRLRKLIPDHVYTITRTKPAGQIDIQLTGEDLVWGEGYRRLIHPELVGSWVDAEVKRRDLIAKGYLDAAEAESRTQISRDVLWRRAKRLDPARRYNYQGLLHGESEPSVLGSELVWKNPVSTSTNSTYIHPQLVDAWGKAEEREKAYRTQGFLSPEEVASHLEVHPSYVRHRLDEIKPEADYPLLGATQGQSGQTVKGNEIYWHHPYSNSSLVHPELVAGWYEFPWKMATRRPSLNEPISKKAPIKPKSIGPDSPDLKQGEWKRGG